MIGLELFSGAGGMSLGAKASGIDVQQVVEIDLHAANTYLANHTPKFGLFNDDIRKYKPLSHHINCREKLIIFGGPPCQGFSSSNQKTRSSHNTSNWLFEEFVRVVRQVRPAFFVFENVKGILETEKGFFIEKVLNDFEKLGYTVSGKLLNSNDFGVPQSRSRFFLVGSVNGLVYQFPKPKDGKTVNVGSAFQDLPTLVNGANTSYLKYPRKASTVYAKKMRGTLKGCFNHLVTKNNANIVERYKYIPQGGNWENIPNKLMGNYADASRCHTGIYKRLKIDEPSVVIGNYRKNMLIHPTENRGISVREAARLQSFPDNFKFCGSIGFQQQQVGNAVPPLLAKVVFDGLIKQAK